MSFAMIHRGLEREGEDQGGVMSIILVIGDLGHSQKIYSSAKFLESMRRSNFISNLI